MKRTLTILACLIFGMFLFAGVSGDVLDRSEIFGSIFVAVFFALISLTMFIASAWPNRLKYPRLFKFSQICFAWSLVQAPTWIIIAGAFPPRTLSTPLATLAVSGIVLCLLGPGMPGFIHLLSIIRQEKSVPPKKP